MAGPLCREEERVFGPQKDSYAAAREHFLAAWRKDVSVAVQLGAAQEALSDIDKEVVQKAHEFLQYHGAINVGVPRQPEAGVAGAGAAADGSAGEQAAAEAAPEQQLDPEKQRERDMILKLYDILRVCDFNTITEKQIRKQLAEALQVESVDEHKALIKSHVQYVIEHMDDRETLQPMGMEGPEGQQGAKGKEAKDKKKKKKQKDNVIVVGAGAAGLAAASQLVRCGVSVTVLEASDQVGGRSTRLGSLGTPLDVAPLVLMPGDLSAQGSAAAPELQQAVHMVQALAVQTGVELAQEPQIMLMPELPGVSPDALDAAERLLTELCKEVASSSQSLGEALAGALQKRQPPKAAAPPKQEASEAAAATAVKAEGDQKEAAGAGADGEKEGKKEAEGEEEPKGEAEAVKAEEGQAGPAVDPNVLQLVHWYLRVWEMMLRTPLDALPASVAASIRQRVATPAWGPQSGAQAKMVQALAQGLDVKLNSPVTKVDYGKSGVTVTTQSGEELQAGAVILAVPLGVLRAGTITFEPELPVWKTDVVSRLGLASCTHVALEFEQDFWSELFPCCVSFGVAGHAPSAAASAGQGTAAAAAADGEGTEKASSAQGSGDAPLFSVFDAQQGAAKPLLIGRIVGSTACSKADAMSDSQLVDAALASLQAALPGATIPTPSATSIIRWPAPPASAGSEGSRESSPSPGASGAAGAGGAYTYLNLDTSAADPPVAALRLKRTLLFAGEHTAPAPLLGSLAGALLSGVREAARAYKLVKLEEEDDLEVWDEEELDTDALKAEAKAREKERKKAAKRKKEAEEGEEGAKGGKAKRSKKSKEEDAGEEEGGGKKAGKGKGKRGRSAEESEEGGSSESGSEEEEEEEGGKKGKEKGGKGRKRRAASAEPPGEDTGLYDRARFEAQRKRMEEQRQEIKIAHKAVLQATKGVLGPLTDLMRACEGPENRGQLLTSLVQAPIEALDAVAKDEGLLKLLRTWLQELLGGTRATEHQVTALLRLLMRLPASKDSLSRSGLATAVKNCREHHWKDTKKAAQDLWEHWTRRFKLAAPKPAASQQQAPVTAISLKPPPAPTSAPSTAGNSTGAAAASGKDGTPGPSSAGQAAVAATTTMTTAEAGTADAAGAGEAGQPAAEAGAIGASTGSGSAAAPKPGPKVVSLAPHIQAQIDAAQAQLEAAEAQHREQMARREAEMAAAAASHSLPHMPTFDEYRKKGKPKASVLAPASQPAASSQQGGGAGGGGGVAGGVGGTEEGMERLKNFVSKELTKALQEGRITKDKFKPLREKIMAKVLESKEAVDAGYVSRRKEKIAKLVEGYVQVKSKAR